MNLTHFDDSGEVHMVDVGEKERSDRVAIAQAVITMKPETVRLILDHNISKGDVFACARVAGIMAAKKTSDLIPLCHPIPIEGISIDIEAINDKQIQVSSALRCVYKTGIEMEALTAVSIAALTIYDMCKAVDRAMEIGEIRLLYKAGGRSGEYNDTKQQ